MGWELRGDGCGNECSRKPVPQCQNNATLKQPLLSSSYRVVLQNLQGKSHHKGSGGLSVAGDSPASSLLPAPKGLV